MLPKKAINESRDFFSNAPNMSTIPTNKGPKNKFGPRSLCKRQGHTMSWHCRPSFNSYCTLVVQTRHHIAKDKVFPEGIAATCWLVILPRVRKTDGKPLNKILLLSDVYIKSMMQKRKRPTPIHVSIHEVLCVPSVKCAVHTTRQSVMPGTSLSQAWTSQFATHAAMVACKAFEKCTDLKISFQEFCVAKVWKHHKSLCSVIQRQYVPFKLYIADNDTVRKPQASTQHFPWRNKMAIKTERARKARGRE